MSEHTPLTEAERIERLLVDHEYLLQYRSGGICTCGFVPTVEANSLKTQQDYHRAHIAAVLAARTSAATADTGLRERVEALADAWEALADEDPYDSSDPGGYAADLRAALDATAAPTTDTGARDE